MFMSFDLNNGSNIQYEFTNNDYFYDIEQNSSDGLIFTGEQTTSPHNSILLAVSRKQYFKYFIVTAIEDLKSLGYTQQGLS